MRKAVNDALGLLDEGKARVAERQADGRWRVNQWLKKAVLLSFRLNDMSVIAGGPGKAVWWDKVDSKFKGWSAAQVQEGRLSRRARLRGAAFGLHRARRGADAVLRQSRRLRRLAAPWSTPGRRSGSCAQIGKNCHFSGGVGIGGVLEPLQAGPVIIEDNCFVGARSEVVEGVIVREGSVLAMGVYIGALHQDRRPRDRQSLPGRGAALFGGGVGHACRASRCRTAAGAEPLLRRHRQARGRAHAFQDLDQRIAARLMSADPVAIARDLLRCRSVTPAEGGALKYLEARAEGCGLCRASPGFQRAGRGHGREPLCAARQRGAQSDVRRPHRRGAAGRREGLVASALCRRERRQGALRPRRGRHEGRHRLRARRRARSSRGATRQAERARSRS